MKAERYLPARIGLFGYCVQIIANISILLNPFLPISSGQIQDMIGIKTLNWKYYEIESGSRISNVTILFERIDTKMIEEETERLKNS